MRRWFVITELSNLFLFYFISFILMTLPFKGNSLEQVSLRLKSLRYSPPTDKSERTGHASQSQRVPTYNTSDRL